MNFNFYIFGTPEERYSQYPGDYTAPFLSSVQQELSGIRLVIYREMNLMHYVFAELLENNQIIGFCLIFNDAKLRKPLSLIKLFRFIIEKQLVESGNIFRYSNNGNLVFQIKTMNECTKEYECLKDFINTEFEQNASKYDIVPLNSIYNGIKSVGFADENMSDAQIWALTNQYNKVIVNGNDGIRHGYIPQLIASLREQCQANTAEIEDLQKKNNQLNKKKKQYRWVVFLSIAVIASLTGIYFLNDSLSNVISTQNSTISNLQLTLVECNDSIVRLQDSLDKKKSDLASLSKEFPIRILDIDIANVYQNGDIETDYGSTIYSNNTMYLNPRVKYVSIGTQKSINLNIKWYTPNGSLSIGDSSPKGFSLQTSFYVHKGYNTQDLSGWGNSSKGYWKKGTNRIEIWYKDVCLKAKTIKIH